VSDTLVAGRLPIATLGAVMAAFADRSSPLAALFPARPEDPSAFAALARSRASRGIDAELGRSLVADHERIGAPAASIANAKALAAGDALCVVTGQQPGPLAGPLYTWHKAWTAVVLARRLTAALGRPVVPVFWNATEDEDFDEIARASWGDANGALVSARLPREAAQAGRLVGALPSSLAAGVWQAARASWAPLAGSARAARVLEAAARTAERGGDLGEVSASLVLHAMSEAGVVVCDPRRPAFRRAALPLYERYVARATDVQSRVDRTGAALESMALPRGFSPVQTAFGLFEALDGARRHVQAAEADERVARARRGEAAFIPGAMLRPVAQDFVLPCLALVAGPGEIGYLAQLPDAFAALEVEMSVVVPRWSATWLTPAALETCALADVTPEALVQDPDGALRAFLAQGVPAELVQSLAELRAKTLQAIRVLGERATSLDASLPQFTAASAARIDWRLSKIGEAFAKKARRRWKDAHPDATTLAEYLRPYGALQERSIAWLDPIARGGVPLERRAEARAEEHVAAVLAGQTLHHDLVPIGEDA
jgi:bacillithiol biosynthesis cysteine-adding enzyme BshC